MTTVTIIKADPDVICGLRIEGHAGQEEAGYNIECAAVSTLTVNTINSVDQFTEDQVTVSADEEEGIIEARFEARGESLSPETELLLKSYEMGVTELAKQYQEIRVRFQKRG